MNFHFFLFFCLPFGWSWAWRSGFMTTYTWRHFLPFLSAVAAISALTFEHCINNDVLLTTFFFCWNILFLWTGLGFKWSDIIDLRYIYYMPSDLFFVCLFSALKQKKKIIFEFAGDSIISTRSSWCNRHFFLCNVKFCSYVKRSGFIICNCNVDYLHRIPPCRTKCSRFLLRRFRALVFLLVFVVVFRFFESSCFWRFLFVVFFSRNISLHSHTT